MSIPPGPSAETLLRRQKAAEARSELEQRRLQRTTREKEFAKSAERLLSLTRVHVAVPEPAVRQNVDEYGFLEAVPPIEKPKPVPPIHERAALLAEHLAHDSADLHFWQRGALREAKVQAQRETDQDIASHLDAEAQRNRLVEERKREHDKALHDAALHANTLAKAAQKDADKRWELLLANDPDTVLASVDHAYGDDNPHALAVESEGDTITVIATYQNINSLLPAKQPYETPGGRFSERSWPMTSRNEFYVSVIASDLLHVARSTFAAAPKIATIQIAALRDYFLGESHEPRYRMDVIYRGTLSRTTFDDVNWQTVDPISLIRSAEGAELITRGRTHELVPIEIDQEWQLFLDSVSDLYLSDWERLRGQAMPEFDSLGDTRLEHTNRTAEAPQPSPISAGHPDRVEHPASISSLQEFSVVAHQYMMHLGALIDQICEQSTKNDAEGMELTASEMVDVLNEMECDLPPIEDPEAARIVGDLLQTMRSAASETIRAIAVTHDFTGFAERFERVTTAAHEYASALETNAST